MNQIDEFFEGLPTEGSKSEGELDLGNGTPATPAEGDNKGEGVNHENGDEPRKNRRHRRLEMQLQETREELIRAQALADARSENRVAEVSGDVDARWIQIYGDTPETRQAWKLQQDILNDYKDQAKQEAQDEFRQQQAESVRQQKEFESVIDSELENIEDEFNVDVTSDSPAARKARREFLEMVERASPKDSDGTVTAYADFGTVWEYYQMKKGKDKPNNDRRNEISSRTMSKSQGTGSNEQTITPGFDGWRKDYGLN